MSPSHELISAFKLYGKLAEDIPSNEEHLEAAPANQSMRWTAHARNDLPADDMLATGKENEGALEVGAAAAAELADENPPKPPAWFIASFRLHGSSIPVLTYPNTCRQLPKNKHTVQMPHAGRLRQVYQRQSRQMQRQKAETWLQRC